MSLIGQIINELADPSIGLSGPLLKTQVFASRVGNAALKEWTSNELTGYQHCEDVPLYRRYQSHLTMNYQMNPFAQVQIEKPVAINHLSLESAKKLVVAEFTESVVALERIRDKNLDRVNFAVSAAQQGNYQNSLRKLNEANREIVILDIYKELSGTLPAQILDSVRQKLLEFMLAIEAEYGEKTDIVQLQQYSQNITTIMNTTINNSGHNAAINAGAGATVTTSSVVNIGSRDELANRLREQAVSELDIEELMTVVDQESPDLSSDRFSQPVNTWISKMLNKALDGTWSIGVGTAAGVITELIKAYYGMSK